MRLEVVDHPLAAEQARVAHSASAAHDQERGSSTARPPIRSTTPSAPPGTRAGARPARRSPSHRAPPERRAAARHLLRARRATAQARGARELEAASRRRRCRRARACLPACEASVAGGRDERLAVHRAVPRNSLSSGMSWRSGAARTPRSRRRSCGPLPHDRDRGAGRRGLGAPRRRPTHSMPRMRGNATASPDQPRSVMYSERLSPNASTRTSAQPGRGSGRGTSRTTSPSGPSGRSATAARMLATAGSLPAGLRTRIPRCKRRASPGSGRGGAWRRSCSATSPGLGGMILVKGVFLSADRYFLILLVPARRAAASGAPTCATSCPSSRSCCSTRRPAASRTRCTRTRSTSRCSRSTAGSASARCPTIRLQDWLWHGHLEWYDHALSLLDRLHFIVPPTLLLLIWLERREVFYRCAATLVAVSFAGAATFLAFPAAPPWLASKHGLIPHVAAHRLHRGRQLAGRDVEVVDRVAPARQPGRRRAVAARRLRPARRCSSPTPGAAGAGALSRRRTRSGCGSRSSTWATTTSPTSSSARPTRSAGWMLVPQLLRRGPFRRLLGPFPSPLSAGDKERSDVLRSGP